MDEGYKGFDGTNIIEFTPELGDRDTSHRSVLSAVLRKLFALDAVRRQVAENDENLLDSLLQDADKITASGPNLTKAQIAVYDHVQDVLMALESNPKLKELGEARALIGSSVLAERAPTPSRAAIDAVWPRRPRFLMFSDEHRSLESFYSIPDLSANVPPVLQGILDLAEVSPSKLIAANQKANEDDLTTLERQANKRLATAYKKAWSQSGIKVALRFSANMIRLQIENDQDIVSGLDERSTGLRQFVALQSFALQSHAECPILLIDEAEQHLHYDAQADLMNMLVEQNLAPKVIITTHSAGCLPEDIGTGTAFVRSSLDNTTSNLVSKFWTDGGLGFSPMLVGMGAATLAFFPTRKAVMVEGVSDIILLPRLFKAASVKSHLGFQFVPGLAQHGAVLLPISLESTNVVYLVDSDEGGEKIAKQISDAGVHNNLI
ncbi:hypothetical protein SPAN111604_09150 [Sphingomonas antarctica]|uniref:ATP-dependent nuclease n=1 Tax=Sphingomonas antarctica TaxID=2040274 RepID=UPI0039EBC872